MRVHVGPELGDRPDELTRACALRVESPGTAVLDQQLAEQAAPASGAARSTSYWANPAYSAVS